MMPYPALQNDKNATLKASADYIARLRQSDIAEFNTLKRQVITTGQNAGFGNFINQVPAAPTVSGLDVILPDGTAVVGAINTSFPQVSTTFAANTVTDYWLNSDGSWTIETQPTNNYPALPHYSNKLHVWNIATTGSLATVTLMGNTYPTVVRPNDIAGTIDTFAELFYLYTATTNWSSMLAVTYGELLVTSTGNVYQVAVPGTTGSIAPTATSGVITDGSATLNYYCQSSYLGMFRYGPGNGVEYYFVNKGLESVTHKTLITGSPLGSPAGTQMAALVKNYIQGVFKHAIANRVDSGTYVFGMKMIAGGYIWLNTTTAGGTAAGSSPFSGSYTPGVSTVVDGTITWLCIYASYASQNWFWMNVDQTFLTYRAADSHDSYASTLASLLARYIQLTGDYSWMTGASTQPSGAGTYWTYQQIFGYIINGNLDTQVTNFLSQTFQANVNPADGTSFTTQYLEDNCESVKGYRDAAYVYGILGDTTRQTNALAFVPYIGSGIASLYNGTYNLFGYYYGDDLSWATNANISWYPYLQCQFFPELCSVATINDDQLKLVRYNVSLKWPSYFNDKSLNSFPESFLGFLAARAWQDTEKAYDSIEKMERYFITGGTVAQGAVTLAGGLTITDWGYYLATKDILISPRTLLNINGNILNFLNQNGDVVPITTGAATANIQRFTSSGTWTKPIGAKSVQVIATGAGGGGGAGPFVAAATSCSGGAGGGGGSNLQQLYNSSDLTSTVTITIGAAGSAGVGPSSAGVGGDGGIGGDSSFGSYITAYAGGAGSGGAAARASAGGGGGGARGDGISGSGATAGTSSTLGGANGASGAIGNTAASPSSGCGGAGTTNGGAGLNGANGGGSGGSGASGGGINGSNTTTAGGGSMPFNSGTAATGGAAGTSGAGGDGASYSAVTYGWARGGNGGGSATAGRGGDGSAGQAPGGGGAGGGASQLTRGGNGGAGGRGEVLVITYF